MYRKPAKRLRHGRNVFFLKLILKKIGFCVHPLAVERIPVYSQHGQFEKELGFGVKTQFFSTLSGRWTCFRKVHHSDYCELYP